MQKWDCCLGASELPLAVKKILQKKKEQKWTKNLNQHQNIENHSSMKLTMNKSEQTEKEFYFFSSWNWPIKTFFSEQVKLTSTHSPDLSMTQFSSDLCTYCLCGGESKAVRWTVAPTVLGEALVAKSFKRRKVFKHSRKGLLICFRNCLCDDNCLSCGRWHTLWGSPRGCSRKRSHRREEEIYRC